MRSIFFGFSFIISFIIFGCRKNIDALNVTPPPPTTPVDNTPQPTYQRTNDSIIVMMQFVEDRAIFKESDTAYNSSHWISSPMLIFWTKGGKKYAYRRSTYTNNKFIADYAGHYNLIDTSQSVSLLNDDWADWMRSYPINKQILDSSVFNLQVNDNTVHKMYFTSETKIIAASLPTSPMLIGRWINSIFNRIKGMKYHLSSGEDTFSLNDNTIKYLHLFENTKITKESDTTGNYIWKIFIDTESGQRLWYSLDTIYGKYKADYVGSMDLINVAADTVPKPSEYIESVAMFQINRKVTNAVGFVVHTKEGGFRNLYLTNKTLVKGEINNNLSVEFIATWYNIALNRLRGMRFR